MSTPPTPPWEPTQGEPQSRPRPYPQPQPPSQPAWQPPQGDPQVPPAWQPPPSSFLPPPPPGWQPPGYVPPEPVPLVPPTPPRRRARLLAPIAAGVLLAGGGAITYVALSDTAGGAGSPRDAVQTIVDDINSSDLVGMLDALAPAERTSIADPLIKDFDQLKRIKILSADADLGHVSGVGVHVSDLKYGPTVVINDHVQIVQLIGGTVRATGTASQLPLSREFVQQAFPDGLPAGSQSDTANLADAVQQLGRPIRIATEKVDGHWYPSVLYTIADNAATAAGLPKPSPSDAVPAVGQSSPEEAVRTMVRSLLAGNVPGAIQVLAPDELAALHDYGGLITQAVGDFRAPFTVTELDLDSKPGPNGSALVHLTSVALRMSDGDVRMTVNGDCVVMSGAGGTDRVCTADIVKELRGLARRALGRPLTASEQSTLQKFFGETNVAGGGVVTTKVNGEWYVNPLRTLLGGTTSFLGRLQSEDVRNIVNLIHEFGG